MRSFQGRLLVAALLFTAATLADDKKQKPAVVELQEFKVAIENGQLNIDGTVHNSGDRTIQKLVLSFHFFDTEHQAVSTLKMDVDEEVIHPGDDAEIHAAAHEPARAVSVEITAAARGEKELKVIHPGPYQIE